MYYTNQTKWKTIKGKDSRLTANICLSFFSAISTEDRGNSQSEEDC